MIKKLLSILCLTAILLGSISLYSCKKSSGSENEDSGFDTDDWIGDVKLPDSPSTEVPDNYVVPVRYEDEADDSAAIDRALEAIKETGGTIYFCESSYTISKPITIYKNITYVGRGIGQTTITVKEGANCDAFITQHFDSYCDQKNYDKVTSAYFGPNSELPQNFEIKGLTIDGNAGFICTNTTDNIYKPTKNTEGSGIKIFGKRYIIENVQIQNFAEIGFYTEFNSPEVTGVDTSFDYFICTKIDGLRVISTGEEGLVYRGPTDQELDGLWICASCLTGKSSLYADRSNWELASVVFEDRHSSNNNTAYCASPELGFAHIWRGFNCWGMVLVGQLRFKADHLIIESTNGGLKTGDKTYSQISILDIHNCMYGDNSRPYMEINSNTHTKISNLEMRYGYDKSQKDMLLINGDNVTIGECMLRANADIAAQRKFTPGGHGIIIKGNYNQISALNATYFAGKGSDGQTASAIVIAQNANRNIITGVITNSSIGATVADGNNTLNLTTRTDSGNNQFPISASESVLKALDLTLLDYNATGKVWTKYPNQISSYNSIDATVTTVQTVSIAHECTVTPALSKIQATLLNSSGLDDFGIDYISVVSADASNVTLKIKLSRASGTANAKLGLLLNIG